MPAAPTGSPVVTLTWLRLPSWLMRKPVMRCRPSVRL